MWFQSRRDVFCLHCCHRHLMMGSPGRADFISGVVVCKGISIAHHGRWESTFNTDSLMWHCHSPMSMSLDTLQVLGAIKEPWQLHVRWRKSSETLDFDRFRVCHWKFLHVPHGWIDQPLPIDQILSFLRIYFMSMSFWRCFSRPVVCRILSLTRHLY